jgi:hypothetical protein
LLVGVKLAPAATTLIYWDGVAANIISAHKMFANTLFGGKQYARDLLERVSSSRFMLKGIRRFKQ